MSNHDSSLTGADHIQDVHAGFCEEVRQCRVLSKLDRDINLHSVGESRLYQ